MASTWRRESQTRPRKRWLAALLHAQSGQLTKGKACEHERGGTEPCVWNQLCSQNLWCLCGTKQHSHSFCCLRCHFQDCEKRFSGAYILFSCHSDVLQILVVSLPSTSDGCTLLLPACIGIFIVSDNGHAHWGPLYVSTPTCMAPSCFQSCQLSNCSCAAAWSDPDKAWNSSHHLTAVATFIKSSVFFVQATVTPGADPKQHFKCPVANCEIRKVVTASA
jgi:hypothetical protein